MQDKCLLCNSIKCSVEWADIIPLFHIIVEHYVWGLGRKEDSYQFLPKGQNSDLIPLMM